MTHGYVIRGGSSIRKITAVRRRKSLSHRRSDDSRVDLSFFFSRGEEKEKYLRARARRPSIASIREAVIEINRMRAGQQLEMIYCVLTTVSHAPTLSVSRGN